MLTVARAPQVAAHRQQRLEVDFLGGDPGQLVPMTAAIVLLGHLVAVVVAITASVQQHQQRAMLAQLAPLAILAALTGSAPLTQRRK